MKRFWYDDEFYGEPIKSKPMGFKKYVKSIADEMNVSYDIALMIAKTKSGFELNFGQSDFDNTERIIVVRIFSEIKYGRPMKIKSIREEIRIKGTKEIYDHHYYEGRWMTK